MKKLITINSILLLLVLSIFIFGYYFIQYPDSFNINRYVREAEWKPFSLILVTLVIASILLSFLRIKSYKLTKKILIFFSAFQSLFLLFLVFKMVSSYKQNKEVLESYILQYKKKADADIKSGFIEIEYAGGLKLPIEDEREQKIQEKIDSVEKTFGLSYKNSGCLVSSALTKAQDEYVKLTKPYLDKRNGPGWESKMKRQIKEIQNNYR